jgi:hypothetical protein
VKVGDNLKIAAEKALALEQAIGNKVVFKENQIRSHGFAGRKREHWICYVITFMPDEFGKSSTYNKEFFNHIIEHGFELSMQVIDWDNREVVHYITMSFGDVK